MSQPTGLFELRTPQDLLEKLQTDFHRLSSSPPISREAQYAAFDFFVTAEHMPDWVASLTGGDKCQLRSYPDGALVSHIANGSKHFQVDPNRHKSVKATEAHHGAFQADAFQSDAFDVDRLLIQKVDGGTEYLLELGERVLAHWKSAIT